MADIADQHNAIEGVDYLEVREKNELLHQYREVEAELNDLREKAEDDR